jgi:hypothetical protein
MRCTSKPRVTPAADMLTESGAGANPEPPPHAPCEPWIPARSEVAIVSRVEIRNWYRLSGAVCANTASQCRLTIN